MLSRLDTGNKIKRNSIRLLAELIIVFVGVYSAQQLAARQARLQEEATRNQLLQALYKEFSFYSDAGEETLNELDQLDVYLEAIKSNGNIPLRPVYSDTPFQTNIWDAIMISGGVELIEPSLLLSLSSFFNEGQAMLEDFALIETYIRQHLVPALDEPPSYFYHESGRLKSSFEWYPAHLGRLSTKTRKLIAEADSLRIILEPYVMYSIKDDTLP